MGVNGADGAKARHCWAVGRERATRKRASAGSGDGRVDGAEAAPPTPRARSLAFLTETRRFLDGRRDGRDHLHAFCRRGAPGRL